MQALHIDLQELRQLINMRLFKGSYFCIIFGDLLLYAIGLISVVAILITGLPYYTMPLSERPHSAMHDQLKPAGIWGHGLGILGSLMMILLLGYSLRQSLERSVVPPPLRPLAPLLRAAMQAGQVTSEQYYGAW